MFTNIFVPITIKFQISQCYYTFKKVTEFCRVYKSNNTQMQKTDRVLLSGNIAVAGVVKMMCYCEGCIKANFCALFCFLNQMASVKETF